MIAYHFSHEKVVISRKVLYTSNTIQPNSKFHSRNTMLVCGRPYEYSYAARIMRELQSSERERNRERGR